MMKRTLSTLGIFCLAASLSAVAQSQTGSYGNSQSPSSSSQATTGTYPDSNTRVVVPSGTELHVRVNENLSSESSQSGDRFTGTLADDVVVDGRTVLPRGADVTGRVMSATPSGRVSAPGTLELAVSTVHFNGQTVNLSTTPMVSKGESHTKSNTAKVGGGAALGAIIGGIAGGGKGAAIGATVGAGAGAAGAAATGKKPATVESEAILKFNTSTDTTVYLAQNSQAQSSYPSSSSSSTTPDAGDQPVLRRHDPTTTQSTTTGSSGSVGGMTTNTTVDRSQTPPVQTMQQTAGATAFTLRDRRVIRSCIAANATTLTSSATTRVPGVQPFQRGAILPTDIQRKVSSLPVACERQLLPEASNTERVLYNRQVLLIDANARVLDAFSLDYQ
jgi:outer membrane lipoprotein SlyB